MVEAQAGLQDESTGTLEARGDKGAEAVAGGPQVRIGGATRDRKHTVLDDVVVAQELVVVGGSVVGGLEAGAQEGVGAELEGPIAAERGGVELTLIAEF